MCARTLVSHASTSLNASRGELAIEDLGRWKQLISKERLGPSKTAELHRAKMCTGLRSCWTKCIGPGRTNELSVARTHDLFDAATSISKGALRRPKTGMRHCAGTQAVRPRCIYAQLIWSSVLATK